MAVIDFNRFPRTSVTFGDVIRTVTVRAYAELTAWNDARKTRNSLTGLTAAQLDDLGLSRGDIDRIASSGRRF